MSQGFITARVYRLIDVSHPRAKRALENVGADNTGGLFVRGLNLAFWSAKPRTSHPGGVVVKYSGSTT